MSDNHERDRVVLAEVARRLSTPERPWLVEDGRVRGPGTVAVVPDDECRDVAANHVGLGFVLNVDRPDAPVIWDCAAGIGETPQDAWRQAVDTWTTGTAPVVLEFLNQSGEHAAHYAADDPEGLPGWHVIHGPVWGWGVGEGAGPLQQWVLAHPLLPLLAEVLPAAFNRPFLNGVKVFFGGPAGAEVAEVRVNGRYADEPADRLRELDWPRLEWSAFVRVFLLAVHGPGPLPA